MEDLKRYSVGILPGAGHEDPNGPMVYYDDIKHLLEPAYIVIPAGTILPDTRELPGAKVEFIPATTPHVDESEQDAESAAQKFADEIHHLGNPSLARTWLLVGAQFMWNRLRGKS